MNMDMRKQPLNVKLLLAIGLLLITLPSLTRDYIILPDFFHGLLTGIGIVLEVVGVIKLKQALAANTSS
jgi:hypothetical protein